MKIAGNEISPGAVIEHDGSKKKRHPEDTIRTDEIHRKLTALMIERKIAHDRVAIIVRHGHPAATIVGAAHDLKADLIVMSTHGRTGVRHVMLGSVAEKVVRHAPCPVLTMKPEEFREMLGVAVYMGGGPSLMYAANALAAFEEFSAAANPA